MKLLMHIRICFLILLIMMFVEVTQATEYNATNLDLMFTVNSGDTINFTSNLTGILSWNVNKTNNSYQITDNLVWVAPTKDTNPSRNIYEISVNNSTTNTNWVISTNNISEAPEFIDYFVDMGNAHLQKDPWDRNVLNWTQTFGSINYSQKTISTDNVSISYARNDIASLGFVNGTIQYWTYWSDIGDIEAICACNDYSETITFMLSNRSTTPTTSFQPYIRSENAYDEHLWTGTITTEGSTTTYNYEESSASHGNQEYPVNKSGYKVSGGWHKWTWIIYSDDEFYIYFDDMGVYSTREHLDRSRWTTESFRWLGITFTGVSNHLGMKMDIDGVEIYKGRYIFPSTNITMNDITNEIQIKSGNPYTLSLSQINSTLNNASLFRYYESNKTGYSYKPIRVLNGGSLNIVDEIFYPTGYIFLNNSANLQVVNSTITNTTAYSINYTSYNESYTLYSGWIVREGAQNITIINSTINNSGFSSSMGPYILNIRNSRFTNMASSFSFGQQNNMFHMYNFNITNTSFSGNLNLIGVNAYLSNGYAGQEEYIQIQDVSAGTISAIELDNIAGGRNSNVTLKNVIYSSLQTSNYSCSGCQGEILASYYTDIFVKASNGTPISNASIIITNANDTSQKYDPISLNISSIWNVWTAGYYEREYIKTDWNNGTHTTDSSGHTKLPIGNETSTILLIAQQNRNNIITNYSYNISVCAIGYVCNNNTIITPNNSWYRLNPNTYQNTTLIILQSSSSPEATSARQNYVSNACVDSLNWGVVGSAMIIILILILAGGLAIGFMTGQLNFDTFPIMEFTYVLIAVVCIGAIGVGIISPIINLSCP